MRVRAQPFARTLIGGARARRRQRAGKAVARATWTAVPPRMLSTAWRRHRCRPRVAATARMSGSAWGGVGQRQVARAVDDEDHHHAEWHAGAEVADGGAGAQPAPPRRRARVRRRGPSW